MKNDLDQTLQRTKQYWYTDGLNEIAIGAIFLLLSLYFLLEVFLPPKSLLATLLTASFVLIIAGGGLLAGRVVNEIKTRLTYPRTGYVAYRQARGSQRLFLALIAMLMASLITMLIASTPASRAWIPALTGFIIGAMWLFAGYKIGITRFYLLAAVSSLLGAGISLVGLGEILGAAVFYGLMSLAMIISGGLTLGSYLRQTQPLQEKNNER